MALRFFLCFGFNRLPVGAAPWDCSSPTDRSTFPPARPAPARTAAAAHDKRDALQLCRCESKTHEVFLICVAARRFLIRHIQNTQSAMRAVAYLACAPAGTSST